MDSHQIDEKILRLINNEISEQDFCELREWLRNDPEALIYYCTFVSDYIALRKQTESEFDIRDDILSDPEVWAALSLEEKTAETVSVARETIPHERDSYRPVIICREPRKINKFSLYSSIFSAAAMLLVISYVLLNPRTSGDVATLVDSINVKWSDSSNIIDKGSRVFTDQGQYSFAQGILKMDFDEGVRVLIEGPAEYEVTGRSEIRLHSGRLYAQVTDAAESFTVATKQSKIIDMGTEFGVQAEVSGNTEVHVYKGKVSLLSKGDSSVDMTQGQAKRVTEDDGRIVDITLQNNKFVRDINSKSRYIWRGQNAVLLTDLLAGGIFDSSPDGIEINPVTGKHVIHGSYVSGILRRSGAEYHLSESPFIDGTFVPQGQHVQTISSTNLTWQSPQTSGSLYYNLSDQKTIYDVTSEQYYPLSLKLDSQETSSLLFHPNMGITLDLDRIREKIPTLQIQRFRVDCGVSFSTRNALSKIYPDSRHIPDDENPSVDFVVLLDGKVCKELIGINLETGIYTVDVEISPTIRFLTLVSTDGNQSTKYDWFILSDPVLEITAKN